MVLLPLLSVAVGASKVQAAPCSTVLLVLLQVITGAVVSTTVTFWLQWPDRQHVAEGKRVDVGGRRILKRKIVFVTVLTIVMVLLPLLSVAVGASKVQAAPCSTV